MPKIDPDRFGLDTVYLGIDPGIGGGIVVFHGAEVKTYKMPTTERDLWDLVKSWADVGKSNGGCRAVIEQIDPRPTKWFDGQKWQGSILKSTCLLYGNYLQLRGMLVAAGIPFQECPPARWQKTLDIPGKKKGEADNKWKNRLKARAQQTHPELTVTLAVADAILIAEYCRKVNQ